MYSAVIMYKIIIKYKMLRRILAQLKLFTLCEKQKKIAATLIHNRNAYGKKKSKYYFHIYIYIQILKNKTPIKKCHKKNYPYEGPPHLTWVFFKNIK